MTRRPITGGSTASTGVTTAGAPPSAGALAVAAVVGCEFMLQLDTTIVTVALPRVQGAFTVSPTSLSWVTNAFGLAFGGLLLLGGRLGDVFGHRRVFLTGVTLFGAGAALAGLAPDFWALLAGRACQGAGAGLAGPTGLALLTITVPPGRQTRVLAVYSTVTGLGATAGLIVGGILVWAGNWRWTLLVNAPVGAILLLVATRVLPVDRPGERRPVDALGLAVCLPGLILVSYGLVRAAAQGWADPVALAGVAVGAGLLAGFLALEARAAAPMLPPQILRHPDRAFALSGAALMAFVLTSFLFFSTQFLQHVRGITPLLTGLAYLPFALALMCTARVVPQVLTRLSPRLAVTGGFILMAGGTGWLATLHQASGYPGGVLGPMVLLGTGAGLAVVPLNVIALSSTPPEDKGVVSAALQAALAIGGSIGLAVLLSVFSADHHGLASAIARAFAGDTVVAVAAALLAAAAWARSGPSRMSGSQGRARHPAHPLGGAFSQRPRSHD